MTDAAKNYRYTSSHEWVSAPEDGVVTVGLTDHAQKLLGDVVYVELPNADDTITQDKEVMVVESVKAAADVFAPVSGEITAINEALNTSPELVNQSPFKDGWLFKMTVADPQSLDALMDQQAYLKTVQES